MMNTTLLTLVTVLAIAYVPATHSQDLRAITEDGRKVILTPDGRWGFDNKAVATAQNYSTSSSPYQTDVKNFSLAFDTSKWDPLKQEKGDESSKRTFKHKSLPLYGVVVADEIPATTETVRRMILYNAKSASGSAVTVIQEQNKEIAEKSVGSIRFAGSLEGFDFVFSSYYYGDADGNIQVMCYTGQSIFYKYEAECQKFLSGLTIK